MDMKVVFIGSGNMAGSLMGGLISDGFPAENITAVDIDESRLATLKQQFEVNVTSDAQNAISQADTVVLGVKPQALKEVVEKLASTIISTKPLLISIAAGIRSADLQRWSGGQTPVVRAMPNTPAMVQCGATALFANRQVSQDQKETAESIMRSTGLVVWLEQEEHMNVVTALSGSGPAYFFRIMEALEKAAVDLGLPQKTAQLLTLQTALGAAKLALESSDSVEQLRQSVTSPGGTTEQGLKVMESANIDKLIGQVVNAANERAKELAQQLGE